MPESPEVNLEEKIKEIKEIVSKYGEFGGTKIIPIAFGLKALNVFFIVSEDKENLEDITKEINKINGVENTEIIDIRRDFM